LILIHLGGGWETLKVLHTIERQRKGQKGNFKNGEKRREPPLRTTKIGEVQGGGGGSDEGSVRRGERKSVAGGKL